MNFVDGRLSQSIRTAVTKDGRRVVRKIDDTPIFCVRVFMGDGEVDSEGKIN